MDVDVDDARVSHWAIGPYTEPPSARITNSVARRERGEQGENLWTFSVGRLQVLSHFPPLLSRYTSIAVGGASSPAGPAQGTARD